MVRLLVSQAYYQRCVKAACSQGEFLSRLLELVHDVWRKGHVLNDWRDAILVILLSVTEFVYSK